MAPNNMQHCQKKGQVLEVVEKEVQVSSMPQLGENNLFMWPQTPDIIFYDKQDVHAVISRDEN